MAIKVSKGSIQVKGKTWVEVMKTIETLESSAESDARDWVIADGWKE